MIKHSLTLYVYTFMHSLIPYIHTPSHPHTQTHTQRMQHTHYTNIHNYFMYKHTLTLYTNVRTHTHTDLSDVFPCSLVTMEIGQGVQGPSRAPRQPLCEFRPLPVQSHTHITPYTMFGPKKQVSGFSYTPAILHDLHENKLFYMKTSFLQENKVSDFSYTPVAQFAHQNVWDLPGF